MIRVARQGGRSTGGRDHRYGSDPHLERERRAAGSCAAGPILQQLRTITESPDDDTPELGHLPPSGRKSACVVYVVPARHCRTSAVEDGRVGARLDVDGHPRTVREADVGDVAVTTQPGSGSVSSANRGVKSTETSATVVSAAKSGAQRRTRRAGTVTVRAGAGRSTAAAEQHEQGSGDRGARSRPPRCAAVTTRSSPTSPRRLSR